MSLEQALTELGQHIQLEISPAQAAQGLQLRLDSQARIGIAAHETHVRVHISHPVQAYETSPLLLRALKQDTMASGDALIQHGWFEQDAQDWFVQAIQIPLEQINATRLRQAIDLLMSRFELLRAS